MAIPGLQYIYKRNIIITCNWTKIITRKANQRRLQWHVGLSCLKNCRKLHILKAQYPQIAPFYIKVKTSIGRNHSCGIPVCLQSFFVPVLQKETGSAAETHLFAHVPPFLVDW